jgi:hypothetical protein
LQPSTAFGLAPESMCRSLDKSPAKWLQKSSYVDAFWEISGRVDDRLRGKSAKKCRFPGLSRGDDRNQTGVDGFAERL